MHHAARCFVLSLLVTCSLTAQRMIGPGVSITSTGTLVNTGQAPSMPAPGSGEYPERQAPIFLSGTVVTEGDAGPAANATIQQSCSGMPRTIAFTNSQGHFSVQLGATTGVLSDASESGPGNGVRTVGDVGASGPRSGPVGAGLLGCELIVSATGFRPARLDLSNRRASDNADLGMIVVHRIAGVEGTSVSITALNAPKGARRAWEKGVQLLHKSRLVDAEKEFEKAVGIYPKYANAWLDLGRTRIRRHREGPAREAFLKAIDADGKLVEPWVELGEMAAHGQNWPDAARYWDRALQLDPVDFPRLWFKDALADYHVQNFDRAERNAREALKVAPQSQDVRAHRLLGLILMKKQDYPGAAEALRNYVRLAPNANDLAQVKAQLDEIERNGVVTKP
jgi:Flp pilus assembly protein TadD